MIEKKRKNNIAHDGVVLIVCGWCSMLCMAARMCGRVGEQSDDARSTTTHRNTATVH